MVKRIRGSEGIGVRLRGGSRGSRPSGRGGSRWRAESSRGQVAGRAAPAPGGAPPSGAEGLIEVEVRDGVRIGGIEGGRLVEVEERIGVVGRLVGRRRAGGGERWWGGGKAEVAEDTDDGEGVGEAIREVLQKMSAGGLLVTDGSNCPKKKRNPYAKLGQLRNSDVIPDEAVTRSMGFVDPDGRVFECIGSVGMGYGPTLVWRVTPQVEKRSGRSS